MCQVTTGRSQLADKATHPNNIKHKGTHTALINHAAPSASRGSVAVATITGLHSAKSHEIAQLASFIATASGHSDSLDDKKNDYAEEKSETRTGAQCHCTKARPHDDHHLFSLHSCATIAVWGLVHKMLLALMS